MEQACEIIVKVVSEEILKRKRYPLEWAGQAETGIIWRANVAASNCYQGGKQSVGFHSDQMTYLGPDCTIGKNSLLSFLLSQRFVTASLSLGTRRNFTLREVIPTEEKETRSARTLNIPLSHNTVYVTSISQSDGLIH
jgi:hypothetical protein